MFCASTQQGQRCAISTHEYRQLAAERRAADSSCSNAPSYLSSKRDCKKRGKGVSGDLEKARGVGVDGWTLSSVARARVT